MKYMYVVKHDIPKEDTGCGSVIKKSTILQKSYLDGIPCLFYEENWVCDFDCETFYKYIKEV